MPSTRRTADKSGHDPDTDTIGGNVLSVGPSQLRAEWNDLPTLTLATLLAAARVVPASRGAMSNWPATFSDRAAYIKLRDQIQAKQLAREGKRLAELLKAIWPR